MWEMRITRRSVLGSVGAVSLSPALTAHALTGPVDAALQPDDSPPVRSVPAFDAHLVVGPARRSAADPASGWAPVTGGEVTGSVLRGVVLPGRVEWHVDHASQCVEIRARFSVLRADGVRVEVRDRAVYPSAVAPGAVVGLCTAPELLDAATEQPVSPMLLVGRLDASGFDAGRVSLRAFRVV